MAVDTIGYTIPIRKSRLIPRQEQLAFEMLENHEPIHYAFTPGQTQMKEFHILSPQPGLMRGLTRKERQLKQLLFMALDQLYSSKNVAEVRYWYTEWRPDLYHIIQELDLMRHGTVCLKSQKMAGAVNMKVFVRISLKDSRFLKNFGIWNMVIK